MWALSLPSQSPFQGVSIPGAPRDWAVCIPHGAASISVPFFLSFQVQVSGDKYTLHCQPLDLSKHNLTCVAISLAPYQIMRPDRDKRFYNPCCLCFCLHSPAETANNYHQRQREIYTLSVEVPVCMLSSSVRKRELGGDGPRRSLCRTGWGLAPCWRMWPLWFLGLQICWLMICPWRREMGPRVPPWTT